MCNHILGLLSNKCNPVFKSGWWVITVRFTITTGCLETTTLGKLCSHSLCLERWWQPWWAWWTSWCWKWWQQGRGWCQKPPQASEEVCLPLKSGECTVLQRKEQDGGLGTVTLRVRRFDHCYNTRLNIFSSGWLNWVKWGGLCCGKLHLLSAGQSHKVSCWSEPCFGPPINSLK